MERIKLRLFLLLVFCFLPDIFFLCLDWKLADMVLDPAGVLGKEQGRFGGFNVEE